MFEKAARKKLRFGTLHGNATAEDLWDIPLLSENGLSLDNIAQSLSRELKNMAGESFVIKKRPGGSLVQLKFDIVKHIIDVKLAEEKTAKVLAENKIKKDKILEIIGRKEDESLLNTDVEDLKGMLEDL